jgi:hypothetical protein
LKKATVIFTESHQMERYSLQAVDAVVISHIKSFLDPSSYCSVLETAWLFHTPDERGHLKRHIQRVINTRKNPPKKPRAAYPYQYYTIEARQRIHAEQPDLGFGDLTREVARAWSVLSKAGKERFLTVASENAARYRQLMERHDKITKMAANLGVSDCRLSFKNARTGPKRPRSAYVYFTMDARATVQRENPYLRFEEITRIVASQWNELTDVNKQPYLQLYEDDKARYQCEREEYMRGREEFD